MSEAAPEAAAAPPPAGEAPPAGGEGEGNPQLNTKPSTVVPPQPVPRTGMKNFFYNPDTKACMGRTCVSWCKLVPVIFVIWLKGHYWLGRQKLILTFSFTPLFFSPVKVFIFYIIFFFFVGSFGFVALQVFLLSTRNDEPVFVSDSERYMDVVMKSQGLQFRPKIPLSNQDKGQNHLRSTEIWVMRGDKVSAEQYIRDLLLVMEDGKLSPIRADNFTRLSSDFLLMDKLFVVLRRGKNSGP